jgi:probable rRNA maturation factor
LRLDRPLIRRAIKCVLDRAEFGSATLNVYVVDDATIHELNRKHLAHDYPTDVLSFFVDYDEKHPDGEHIEGEIVVSADTARATAKRLKWKAHHELVLYIVHGMLHLVGYDDRSRKAAALLRRRERDVLAAIGLPPPPERE